MNDPAQDSPRRPHTLADHLYGEGLAHSHDGADADHDHDDLPPEGPLEHDALWAQDHVSLHSVGIDIGSAGTQVIFSRLELARLAGDLSSRYVVVSRETLFQSPVALTPYQSDERIHDEAIGRIVDQAYEEAGLHPDAIDTGVVILTGEALRRENAQAIAEVLAEGGGEFVCATAGHHMEAMLAAYGSGAALRSHETGRRILNVDVGGGTTKLAVIERGRVLATAALAIGGRLLVVDDAGRIVRLDPSGAALAARAGFGWRRGDVVGPGDLDRLAGSMADALLAVLGTTPDRGARPPSDGAEWLYVTAPLADPGRIDGVMFSGGVAEFVYRRESRDFGDLGRRLGLVLRQRIDAGALPWPLLPPGECIRATALGASEYSVQLSGNTIWVSDPGTLLPRRNLQVLQPPCRLDDAIGPDALARAIRDHFTAFDLVEGESEAALAFRWHGPPAYERLAAFARGLCRGLANTLRARRPVFIVMDGDVAQTLGAILRDELGVGSPLLVIDGVTLWDFDYIDLGRIRMPSFTVPVTIKSLVFGADPRLPHGHPHTRPHAHHHGPHPHDERNP